LEKGASFVYTPETLADLETVLSVDRFATYTAAAGGDRRRAIALYDWNGAVSAAFYIPLQAVEVALRNACRRELAVLFGERWPEHPSFRALDQRFPQAIDEVKERLRLLRMTTDAPHIVAELSFGFWTNLFGHRFDRALWVPGLHRVFPRFRRATGTALTRSLIAQRFHHLRKLRNRIAHHEPIFRRALEADYASLLEVADWMYPTLRAWIENVSACAALIAARPEITP
jgi:hypothetical protein